MARRAGASSPPKRRYLLMESPEQTRAFIDDLEQQRTTRFLDRFVDPNGGARAHQVAQQRDRLARAVLASVVRCSQQAVAGGRRSPSDHADIVVAAAALLEAHESNRPVP